MFSLRNVVARAVFLATIASFAPHTKADVLFDSFGPNDEFELFVQWGIANDAGPGDDLQIGARFVIESVSVENIVATLPLSRLLDGFIPAELNVRIQAADQDDVFYNGEVDPTRFGPGTILSTVVFDTNVMGPEFGELYEFEFLGLQLEPGEYYLTLSLPDGSDGGEILWHRSIDVLLTQGAAQFLESNDKWALFDEFFGTWAAAMRIDGNSTKLLLGDINCDGAISLLDVAPFVELISSDEFFDKADINQDGSVDLLDIEPFINLLAGN